MLFTGQISVDPAEITKIHQIEPSSFFRRFLHTISNGKFNDLIEEENFTAVSVLEQFSNAFRALGINNIIRLSHNDQDYFLDKEGDEDDLEKALKNYRQDVKEESSKSFKNLALVMEHNEDTFHYYIEIKINRSHKVGDYPIEIRVNGLVNEFFEKGITKDRLKKKIEHVFRSQDAYDFYASSKLNEFSHFLNMLGDEIKKHIAIDDLIIEYHKAIILPAEPVKKPNEIKLKGYEKGPAFHGYFQSRERLWYAFLWPEICNEHDTYVNNILILSGSGNQIGELGEQGIEAGDSPLFDLNSENPERDVEEEEDNLDEYDGDEKSWF